MNSRLIPTLACLLALAPLAAAGNSKWEIKEIFSSADESVQFIELFSPDQGEEHLSTTSLWTASGSFFAFPNDLRSSATDGRHVLIATVAFAAIPGAPLPDYVIPAGFLEHLGDTLTYDGGPSSVSFGRLPVDGQKSIDPSGQQVANSPTNFAGQTSSITLATAFVRNGSGLNSLCYSAVPPALGKTWNATIDATGNPTARLAIIIGFALPSPGARIPAGELLVDAASPRLFDMVRVANPGINVFSAPVPMNVALLGRTIATQGMVYGRRLQLCNAIDVRIGW